MNNETSVVCQIPVCPQAIWHRENNAAQSTGAPEPRCGHVVAVRELTVEQATSRELHRIARKHRQSEFRSRQRAAGGRPLSKMARGTVGTVKAPPRTAPTLRGGSARRMLAFWLGS